MMKIIAIVKLMSMTMLTKVIVMSDVLSFGELIPDLWSSQDFASRTVIHLINTDISFYIIKIII